jgi:hypothetical protein
MGPGVHEPRFSRVIIPSGAEQDAEKLATGVRVAGLVSGHGFSHTANAAISTWPQAWMDAFEVLDSKAGVFPLSLKPL